MGNSTNHGHSGLGETLEEPNGKKEKEEFVPLPNLTEAERREWDVILEMAGFTAAMKKRIIHEPALAKAMYNVVVAELGSSNEKS